jgi:2-polyprenyl-3-methyl-5-hydroxy-6-metoxy-1,4-benzoquinol methylase
MVIQQLPKLHKQRMADKERKMSNQEWPDLVPETRNIWNQNAGFWDDRMGDKSNDFHNLLVRPATERLLSVQFDELVLDVACGNGNFSRRLAQLGARVIAIDFSETLINRAQARTTEYADRIQYQVVDATDIAQLLRLGQGRFDAAVSNMALMDMATMTPLLEALRQLLKPGGRFVFSLGHPCFQSAGATKAIEEAYCEGEILLRYAIKVSSYITPTTYKGMSIVGQPVPTRYFHRPLNVLFKHCFQTGFVLDGLEEPIFDTVSDNKRAFSWSNFKEIPPVLVARMRLPRS